MTLPAPYYADEWATLYHGDARELAPLIDADRVITDPVWPNASELLRGADDPYGLLVTVLSGLRASVKTVVLHLGCMSDPRIMAAVPPRLPFLRVCWLRYVRCSYSRRILNTGDVAYAFGQLPPSAPGRRVVPGEITSAQPEYRRRTGGHRTAVEYDAVQAAMPHPAPRHARHVRWLVNWFSDPGETVLDPFSGSHTTLLAARRAVAYEPDTTEQTARCPKCGAWLHPIL